MRPIHEIRLNIEDWLTEAYGKTSEPFRVTTSLVGRFVEEAARLEQAVEEDGEAEKPELCRTEKDFLVAMKAAALVAQVGWSLREAGEGLEEVPAVVANLCLVVVGEAMELLEALEGGEEA